MAATQSLHTPDFGPQTLNPPPNNTTATIALPITQMINNPTFSNQEHQTPASQETQQFPANSLPMPTYQQVAEDIAAQSTPPRRRRRLLSQAIRNVSTNYLVHTQTNPLNSQANTDVNPLNTSHPQNGRPAKRAARDRISASSQPKCKCRKHGPPTTQVPDSQHLIIHQHHPDVTTTTLHVNPLFRDDSGPHYPSCSTSASQRALTYKIPEPRL